MATDSRAAADLAWASLSSELTSVCTRPQLRAALRTSEARTLDDNRLVVAVAGDFDRRTILKEARLQELARPLRVEFVVDETLRQDLPTDAFLSPAPATQDLLERPRVRGALARMLAQRGFWSLNPSGQMTLFEVEDLSGYLQVEPSRYGPCGVSEALVFTGLFSLWAAGPRDSPTVETSLRQLAEVLGMSWKGQTATALRRSIDILKLTGYRFIVEDSEAGRDDLFSLLDRVRTRWTGPATTPYRHVSAEFSSVAYAIISDRSQIRPVDLEAIRRIDEQQRLGRRLFLFLEAQDGGAPANANAEFLKRLVDQRLAGALGYHGEMKRFPQRLRLAGDAICSASPRYTSVQVVPRQKATRRFGEARWLLQCSRRARGSAQRKRSVHKP